jgi:phosphoglycolate phosphatase-like HAD superfamily hydrolase
VTVVGDTQHDVDCARANGYRSVAVDSGWVPREALERAGPDALLHRLDDPGVLKALGL